MGNEPLVEEGQARRQPRALEEPGVLDAVVIGGGQAGLAVGYHLKRRGLRFLILEANARVGDVWRQRWDSLELFTPARYDGLPGLPFPKSPTAFPTKDEMADYLEAYAKAFALPVQTNVRVERLWRQGERYVMEAGGRRFVASSVVVAMGTYQEPKVPDFAAQLDPRIVQLHSCAYRSPAQLGAGPVLLVGAGNSGAEIAKDLASPGRRVYLAGRDVGQIPFRMASYWGRTVLARLVLGLVFNHLLTVRNPLGRKARHAVLTRGGPLIRIRAKDLRHMGVERVGRVTGVQDGKPVADGRMLEVGAVVWCCGFHGGYRWIERPIFDERGDPRHERGVVSGEPGLYFVGIHFQYAMSSGMIQGVGRDAGYVVERLAERMNGPLVSNGESGVVPVQSGRAALGYARVRATAEHSGERRD